MMSARSIAVIGAGPIGLEAALEARRLGFDVTVYEGGRIGEHLRRFGHVSLFTPFRMNSTEAGRKALQSAGAAVPRTDELLTGSELVERYLAPLARLPELRDSIREGALVTHVGREGIPKHRAIAAAGDRSRAGSPFLIRVESVDGATRFERADIVLDASGVYSNPNATGPGGLPALGEETLGDRIDRALPATWGGYAGRTILLIGDGHSAATALASIGSLVREDPSAAGTAVHWVHRARGAEGDFAEIQDDLLPARRDLAVRANALARSAPWLTRHTGATVVSYGEGPAGGVRVALLLPSGEERRIDADRVLALVGYRPDTAMLRELQVHLCYASEGPMDLAAAVLDAGLESPQRAGDCLSQVSHRPESLRTPEPGFFILGAKSYGRNSSFLLTIGHRQILDALSLLGAEVPV